MPTFRRYVGIDYSGARTPSDSLPGLRVFVAESRTEAREVQPPPSPRKYWTRREVAEWLVARLAEPAPTIVGIDHGFSFPLAYFQKHRLPHDWPAFLDDFQAHWPTDGANTSVDFVRDGKYGAGARRTGNTRWRRLTEQRAKGTKSVFLFDINGSVAKSTHSGLPWLRYIRAQLGPRVHFWPFDGWAPPEGRSVVAEVYPSLWRREFPRDGRTDDQHDAYVVAERLRRADAEGELASWFDAPSDASVRKVADIEGWILGVPVDKLSQEQPSRPKPRHVRRAAVVEREIPEPLVRSIQAGNCVTFVGAGFAAEAVPGWAKLLKDVAGKAAGPARESVLATLDRPSPTSFQLEACAQKLEKHLGREAFQRALREKLVEPEPNDKMKSRLRWLKGIPFRAVLTTNFDGLLHGSVPGREAYFSVLRSQDHEWWRGRFWDGERQGPRVVKLHGDLVPEPPQGLVFSRRAYRERLYGNPAYRSFLRAVLATSTVLYLGFSFTDAYLNELRSEILALLEHGGSDDPVAWAVLPDMGGDDVEYYAESEGIGVLSYDSRGDKDHSGFDRYLRALHDATNPTHRLGALLAGKRVLWLDAQPRNNDFGMRFLQEAAGSQGCVVETVVRWEQAVQRLERGPCDLLITHWGHQEAESPGGGRCAVAERVLGLGSQGYACEWGHLFREIEPVFGA